MNQQLGALVLNVRTLLGVLFASAVLVGASAVVTAAGSNTILDPSRHPTVEVQADELADSSNAVTAGMASLAQQSQLALISIGRGIYKTSHAISTASSQAGRATVQGGMAVVSTAGRGVGTIGRGFGVAGSGVVHSVGFVVSVPVNSVKSITDNQAVNSFIRPAETVATPVIDGQTSAELLAQYSEQQRQQFAKLLAEQATANQELGGAVAVGKADHGGYPEKWDNARQDSMLDSWGMYNRECVSYAAWKVHQTYGHMPYWGGVGNANEWVANARRAGIPTSKTPKVNSVAISMQGYYGHAMWIEAVKGDMIYVSQYNYDLRGHYSEMWVSSKNLTFLYFN